MAKHWLDRLPWRTRHRDGCDTIALHELAHELGHTDHGHAIRRFLLDPDDGQALISGPILIDVHRLSPRTAERVRHRFA